MLCGGGLFDVGARLAPRAMPPASKVNMNPFSIKLPRPVKTRIMSEVESVPGKGGSRNILRPHPDATGPHSSFKVNSKGQVTGYETYRFQTNPRNPRPWEPVKRVDLIGDEHYNKVLRKDIFAPHVHDPNTPGGLRPALPDEIP